VLGQRRIVVRAQLGPQGRVLLGPDGPRTTRDRLGGEVCGARPLDVAFDGGEPDGEALGDLRRRALLLDDCLDNALP